ncbi:hypothetical protein EB75_28055 [Mycobacterium sp. ST-F2]|nr:hypothetical protein EB75_28055 [Mycobacterium sp. ST-F2]
MLRCMTFQVSRLKAVVQYEPYFEARARQCHLDPTGGCKLERLVEPVVLVNVDDAPILVVGRASPAFLLSQVVFAFGNSGFYDTQRRRALVFGDADDYPITVQPKVVIDVSDLGLLAFRENSDLESLCLS